MCHVVLALPLIALGVFWMWPVHIAVPVYTAIASLSLAVYLAIWRSMQRPEATGVEALLGCSGEVVESHDRSLRVRIRGESWNARAPEHLETGTRVRVIGLDGLELRVRRQPG